MPEISLVGSNPIFISSTRRDLLDHREAVINYLTSKRATIDAMELFGSEPERPLNVCMSKVRKSKAFILIIAFCYGSVDEESGKSFTELEYEEARRQSIPVFAYLMDKSHRIPDTDRDKGELREKLDRFRKDVERNQTVSFFTTPDSLVENVKRDMFKYNHATRLSTRSPAKGGSGKAGGNRNYGKKINWKDYYGIFQPGDYHVAYIPIINTPDPDNEMIEYSYHDLSIHLTTKPFQLPEDFCADEPYKEYDSKCCRLCSYLMPENKIDLTLSETSYLDYLRSGERLDYPSKKDVRKTYRELFGSKINPESANFSLFDLTNICGCGLFILTRDNYLLASRHPDNTSIYPGRWTYSASGTMKFGNYPHPFTEILYKVRDKINHQVDLSRLKLLDFGADARKLIFQFSFLEESEWDYSQIIEKCKESKNNLQFKAIPLDLPTVVEELVNDLWEPAAEAFLLTLCIQRFSYDAVLRELDCHRYRWGRREIEDEWDYRAAHGGVSATLSLRYPKEKLEEISEKYIEAIMRFMGETLRGKDVLEAGSGDGRITLHLAQNAKSVTCVDICDKMIKRSKAYLGHPPCKVEHLKSFVQDIDEDKTFDVAVVSQVLIHNVDDDDFFDFVSKVVKCAKTVFVFEDVTQNRKTSDYTKLRKENEIIQAFGEQGCRLVKFDWHEMHKDKIALLKFEKENEAE